MILYDHVDPQVEPIRKSSLTSWIHDLPEVKSYAYQARNVARHLGYQTRGCGSGVHGLFHQ